MEDRDIIRTFALIACALLVLTIHGCGGGGDIKKSLDSAIAPANDSINDNARNELVLYITRDYSDEYEIHIANKDGTNDRVIDTANYIGDAHLCPDKTELIYVKIPDGVDEYNNREIYRIATNGQTSPVRLTDNTKAEKCVRCMQSGNIYYSQDADEGSGSLIYRMNQDASDNTAVTIESVEIGNEFEISPNEDYAIYSDSRNMAQLINKYDFDTKSETTLADHTGQNIVSNWLAISPDAKSIIYLTDCGISSDVACDTAVVMDTNGAKQYDVSHEDSSKPRWSADSTRFFIGSFYLTSNQQYSNIFVYNPVQQSTRVIFSYSGDQYLPTDWSEDESEILIIKGYLDDFSLVYLKPDYTRNVDEIVIYPITDVLSQKRIKYAKYVF